ncbi:MAG TPA: NUDIX domain-containing protein [Candidatus Pullichristensenella avicola]|nr:NUDIX domain-containing protein [Candidatus Pullichristensenella avicola]
MRHEKSCGAVVFSRIDGAWRVLLIRHEHGRHISFPKGHVEPGESERQTAEREIFEETGVRVNVDTRFRAENRYMARPDVEKLVVFFIAVAQEQTPVAQEGEVAVAEWVDAEEAASRLTYEQDRRILRRAQKYLLRETD